MEKFKVELEVAGQYKVIYLGDVIFRGSPSDCYAIIKLKKEGYY